MPKPTDRRNSGRIRPRRSATATLAAALLVMLTSAAAAQSPSDVSTAVRYGPSAPLGTPIAGLSDKDDATETVALPSGFPINFFGTKYTHLCVTTNGGVFPVVGSNNCNPPYDVSVPDLALYSSAPMIAVLAGDLDLRKDGDIVADGFGTAGEIYYAGADDGTYPALAIDGREAVALTWYRVPMYSNDNDRELSNTFQMVLIKGDGGDATNGFDFTIEFNYGTLTDNENGYDATRVGNNCDSENDDDRADCRWGIGWSNYLSSVDIAEIAVSGGLATLTTDEPHDLGASASSIRLDLPGNAGSAALDGSTVTATVVNGSTLRFATSAADHALVTFSATLPSMDIGEGYELFADAPIDELIDAGPTAMVRNRLGSQVRGRYLFGMTSGETTGFEVPTLTAGDDPAPVDTLSVPISVAVEQASELEGTESVLVRGSTPVPVTTTISSAAGPRGGLVIEDADSALSITVTTSAGVSETAGVVVPTGGEVVCEICARLAAGSVVEAWVYSTPRLAAAVRVEVDAEEGTCPLLRIPTGTPLDGGDAIEPGAHTLQLRMYTDDGFEVLAFPITVGGPVPTSVPSGEGPVPVWPLGLLTVAGAVLGGLTLRSTAKIGPARSGATRSD